MTDTLLKNLSYIKRYNPKTVEKILNWNMAIKTYDLTQNENKEYNLLIDGIAVHSTKNAQDEATKIFDAISHNSPNSIHVIFGIGLGYLVDTFASSSKGSIIIYEPDIETLKIVLSTVDFVDSLGKNNVYLCSDINEFENLFVNLYRFKTTSSISFLNFHQRYYKEALEEFNRKFHKIYELYSSNFTFQVHNALYYMFTTMGALDKKYKTSLITDFKNIYQNTPAIIVSAGPSLNENIDAIKTHQDKALIFCVGTALNTLYKNGIKPDFLNVIEKVNTSAHFNLPCTEDIVAISEPYTHSSIHNKNFKKHLISASLENDSNRWFLEKAEKPLIPFETKGTVSYQALYSAMLLGCNPIILIGQDLAYRNGQCYARGSKFEGLKCIKNAQTGEYFIEPENYEEFKAIYYQNNNNMSDEEKNNALKKVLSDLNKNLILVNGQDGNKLPSEAIYTLFITYLENFANNHGQNLKLINASIGGAKIQGFEEQSLSAIFTNAQYESIDKEKLIEKLNKNTSFDKNVIIKNLTTDIEAIKKVMPKVEEGIKILEKYSKRINHQILDENYLKAIKKLANLYVEITNEYTNKNRLLKTIVFSPNNYISHFMKETIDTMSLEIAQTFYVMFDTYYNGTLKECKQYQKMLEETIENLK